MRAKCFLPMLLLGISLLLFPTPALAADQTQPGGGNGVAVKLSQRSPLVQSAQQFLVQQLQSVQNGTIKAATLDAINNPQTCVAHRAGVTNSQKTAILQRLISAGLVDQADNNTFPGGLIAGIFPPLLQDGSGCPQLPQAFYSAPGSSFNSHHSYPGGLVVHESFNDISDLNLVIGYSRVYGNPQSSGLPIVNPSTSQQSTDLPFSLDVIIAAPIWHDWAKSVVFQWNSDGTEFQELNFGGNGKTDNYGSPGDSRTGAHHIISLAESIKRRLPAELVITQASAHVAPTLGNEYKVVNWINTAAVLAQVDPVATGYLYRDTKNQLRLPPLRQLGNVNLNSAGQTNLLVEYGLHNLSDADFTVSIPAVTITQFVLQTLAPQYGYNPANVATFNTNFRNPVLSFLSAERLLIIYGNRGLAGVSAELNKLRQLRII